MKMVIGSRTGIKEYEAIQYPEVAPAEWNGQGGIELAPRMGAERQGLGQRGTDHH